MECTSAQPTRCGPASALAEPPSSAWCSTANRTICFESPACCSSSPARSGSSTRRPLAPAPTKARPGKRRRMAHQEMTCHQQETYDPPPAPGPPPSPPPPNPPPPPPNPPPPTPVAVVSNLPCISRWSTNHAAKSATSKVSQKRSRSLNRSHNGRSVAFVSAHVTNNSHRPMATIAYPTTLPNGGATEVKLACQAPTVIYPPVKITIAAAMCFMLYIVFFSPRGGQGLAITFELWQRWTGSTISFACLIRSFCQQLVERC